MQWGGLAGMDWGWTARLFGTKWLWRNILERNFRTWLSGSLCGLGNLHPSCIKFPFLFVAPERNKCRLVSEVLSLVLGIVHKYVSVGSTAISGNVWLKALLSHSGYLSVLEWNYWSSRAPLWLVFGFLQGRSLTPGKYWVRRTRSGEDLGPCQYQKENTLPKRAFDRKQWRLPQRARQRHELWRLPVALECCATQCQNRRMDGWKGRWMGWTGWTDEKEGREGRRDPTAWPPNGYDSWSTWRGSV